MNPLIYKYPLDLTGSDPRNRVVGEYHDISRYSSVPYKPVVLDHGCFYADTLAIMDGAGYQLKYNIDYQITGLNAEASSLAGQEVYSTIIIVNPRINTQLYVDANMVGGKYSDVSEHIADLAVTLLNDTRSTEWHRIEGKPNTLRPSGHLHPLWELYGFEHYQKSIQDLREVILNKSRIEIQILQNQLDVLYAQLIEDQTDLRAELDDHATNTDDPHDLTKIQVGLGLVQNHPIASIEEATMAEDARWDRYMTPLGTAQHIEANFSSALQQHIDNRNNPHGVTAEQLDIYQYQEVYQRLNSLANPSDTLPAAYYLNHKHPDVIYDESRRNIPAANVKFDRFKLSQLGSGTEGADRVLTGDQQWTPMASLIQQGTGNTSSQVIYEAYGTTNTSTDIFGNSWSWFQAHRVDPAALKAKWAHVAPGTIILYHAWYYRVFAGNGGGTMYTDYRPLMGMQRTETGWIGPYDTSADESTWRYYPV